MKHHPFAWLLVAVALLGAIFGFLLSTDRLPSIDLSSEPKVTAEPEYTTNQVVFDFPEVDSNTGELDEVHFPSNAIQDELVVHFANRSDYLAYLQLLNESGIEFFGQIDELLAVRIPADALLHANFGQYGARASFSYQVERPLPPREISPEAMASLRAFGISARAISGGAPHGSGEGVIVGILDSGIQPHPQFDDVYIVHIDLAGGGVSGSGAAHGTSVASIITGSEGIVPDAELFVVRVLDDSGMGNSYHVAEGIVQAVDLGVGIINMSLGVYQDTPLLRQAVSYAHERGVLLVAAAGNDGYDRLPFPAAYPEVLAVTAVDANERQAIFPNQSKEIDFAAPGVGVLSAKEDEGTELFSGTSAAAPFVTGTLASLISGADAMQPKEAVHLLQRLLNESGAAGVDPVYGGGVVDWDRLRERDALDVIDVALAGIHLDPEALPGTTMPIEVTVQNRGTRWLSDAQLEVLIGEAEPVQFTLDAIGPGQTTVRKVFTQIPALDSEASLSLAARVLPEDMTEDVRLENNIKAVSFTPLR